MPEVGRPGAGGRWRSRAVSGVGPCPQDGLTGSPEVEGLGILPLAVGSWCYVHCCKERGAPCILFCCCTDADLQTVFAFCFARSFTACLLFGRLQSACYSC